MWVISEFLPHLSLQGVLVCLCVNICCVHSINIKLYCTIVCDETKRERLWLNMCLVWLHPECMKTWQVNQLGTCHWKQNIIPSGGIPLSFPDEFVMFKISSMYDCQYSLCKPLTPSLDPCHQGIVSNGTIRIIISIIHINKVLWKLLFRKHQLYLSVVFIPFTFSIDKLNVVSLQYATF